VRIALVAVALVACAWFALGIRQAHDVNAAGAILDSPRLTGAQARHAAHAAFLNPDRQVDVLRAQLRRDQGDLRGARAILRPVISSEPDNLQAWLELARSSAGDRASASRALFAS
jgi:predicted Zn-dependent protease